jgi:DNA-binding NarL/FixJ family response regulator
MTRVLLVDDHAFVRAQIAEILSAAPDIEVTGACADGADVVPAAAAATPDVILMDLRMPIKSGIEATRDLLAVAPGVRVVILTGSPTPGAVLASAEAGAVGLLLKGGDPDLLIEAVRTVAAGGTAWAIEPKPANSGLAVHRRLRHS